MSLPCVRFADVIEVPAHPDAGVQCAYVHERLRAVCLNAAQWARPLRVLVRGFAVGADEVRQRVAIDPLTSMTLDVEVHFADTATVRPHRMRVYPAKSRRSPLLRVECVYCGATARVANLPDSTVPLFDANGVLAMVPALSDPIEAFDPCRHWTFEAGGNVLWPESEVA